MLRVFCYVLKTPYIDIRARASLAFHLTLHLRKKDTADHTAKIQPIKECKTIWNLYFCLTASTFHAEESLDTESGIAKQLWQKKYRSSL